MPPLCARLLFKMNHSHSKKQLTIYASANKLYLGKEYKATQVSNCSNFNIHEKHKKIFCWYIYEQCTDNGLSYDVVQRLKRTYICQGYRLFIDNFYTSTTLLTALYANNTVACGTVRENRRGFPKTKVNCMPRNAPRGTIRRIQNAELLFVKWKDTREVGTLSTVHKACGNDTVHRKTKNARTCVFERVNIFKHGHGRSGPIRPACLLLQSPSQDKEIAQNHHWLELGVSKSLQEYTRLKRLNEMLVFLYEQYHYAFGENWGQ